MASYWGDRMSVKRQVRCQVVASVCKSLLDSFWSAKRYRPVSTELLYCVEVTLEGLLMVGTVMRMWGVQRSVVGIKKSVVLSFVGKVI